MVSLATFTQPLGGLIVAGGGRSLDQGSTGREVACRAAPFAQTQPVPEETVGEVTGGRRTEITNGERLIVRQVLAEEVTPAQHTLGQRIVRFGSTVQQAESKGERFGVGMVREQHTTGIGQESGSRRFGSGRQVDHKT